LSLAHPTGREEFGTTDLTSFVRPGKCSPRICGLLREKVRILF
jgi:hypothetical protein